MAVMACEKYEGIGNDFLVASDPDGRYNLSADVISLLCHRNLGIGADGFIRLGPVHEAGDVRFDLRNADGSYAETSGNGLRCAALATRLLGLKDAATFDIETSVGISHVVFESEITHDTATIRVGMGVIDITETAAPMPGCFAYRVDVGNPHLVLIVNDIADVDLGELGPRLEAAEPGGINVEVVAHRSDGELDLAVWERGAGLTLACGSGSVAAAGVARLIGLSPSRVVVHNPGGALSVELSGENTHRPEVALIGPARRIGSIEIDLDALTFTSSATQEVTA